MNNNANVTNVNGTIEQYANANGFRLKEGAFFEGKPVYVRDTLGKSEFRCFFERQDPHGNVGLFAWVLDGDYLRELKAGDLRFRSVETAKLTNAVEAPVLLGIFGTAPERFLEYLGNAVQDGFQFAVEKTSQLAHTIRDFVYRHPLLATVTTVTTAVGALILLKKWGVDTGSQGQF
jgi:hypothetical protein